LGTESQFSANLAKKTFAYSTYLDKDTTVESGTQTRIEVSPLTYNILSTPFEYIVGTSALTDADSPGIATEYAIQVNKTQYEAIIRALVLPSTSAIVANDYSAGAVLKILDDMPASTNAIFSDTASIEGYTNDFDSTKDIIVIASVVLAMLSAFIMYSYIYQSIRSKRKNIAIIRSLGARTRDILMVFFLEALMISALIVIGSFASIALFALIGNAIIMDNSGYSLLLFEPTAIFYLAIFAVAVAIIFACYLLPAFVYASNKKYRGIIGDINMKPEN
jgi:ABC-type antimicrobial peptide transport system permease subunit